MTGSALAGGFAARTAASAVGTSRRRRRRRPPRRSTIAAAPDGKAPEQGDRQETAGHAAIPPLAHENLHAVGPSAHGGAAVRCAAGRGLGDCRDRRHRTPMVSGGAHAAPGGRAVSSITARAGAGASGAPRPPATPVAREGSGSRARCHPRRGRRVTPPSPTRGPPRRRTAAVDPPRHGLGHKAKAMGGAVPVTPQGRKTATVKKVLERNGSAHRRVRAGGTSVPTWRPQ
jgi:hypothetical protein